MSTFLNEYTKLAHFRTPFIVVPTFNDKINYVFQRNGPSQQMRQKIC